MKNRILAALTNRSFFFLFVAEVFSQIAMNMMNFMLLLVVFSLTSSNTAVSGIVLGFTIPSIFFAILAGALVDRWDKKKTLIVTNLVRAGFILVLAFFHTNLPIIYTLTFIISIVTQFFIPAETPMIPVLVEKELLLSANALFSIAIFGSLFVAYALSGPILIFLGTQNGFYALAGCFLVAVVCVLCIKVPAREKRLEKQAKPLLYEVKETLKFILKIKKIFHAFSLLIISQTLILIIATIGPGYAKNVLHIPINEFPLLFITPAIIGMGLGIIFISNFFHKADKHKMGTVGLFLTAFTILLMPYGSKIARRTFVHSINTYLPHILQINELHIIVVLAVILGIATSVIFVPSNTILQEETEEAVRGKVYGALNSLTGVVSLLPILLIGTLADIFGVSTVLTILGLSITLLAVSRLFIVL